ncbi:MAG TPA: hypothetical protein VGG39_35195 [Polyangiaceae bacterium]
MLEEKYKFGPRVFLVPPPCAFPRAPTAVLEEHATLVDRAREWLVFAMGETLAHPLFPSVMASTIERHADGSIERDLVDRAYRWRLDDFHGLRRELKAAPEEEDAFPIVVLSPDAVSLQLVRIDSRARSKVPRLSVARRDVIVEPRRQQHWESGAWTLTRWSYPGEDAEARYGWTRTPDPPRDEDDVVERVARFYEPRIDRLVRHWLGLGAEIDDLLVFLCSMECCGDNVACLERRKAVSEVAEYPTIARAIGEDRRRDRVPVFVKTESYEGLYWLSVSQDGTAALDPSPALVAKETKLVDPNDTWRFERIDWSREPTPRGTAIDETFYRLIRSSDAEIDAAIAMAHFDPATERRRGPGLRESVVVAMSERLGELPGGDR